MKNYSNIAAVFVDTDVVIYAKASRDDLKRRVASEWIARLWAERRGRTSAQVLSEYYTNATRKYQVDPVEAWATVEFLASWEPLPMDWELLQQARILEANYRLNWWDAQIVAAARMQGCAILLSEDMQHGAVLGGIRIVNPFVAEVHEEPAPYVVQPVSRHRPRGRPRKQPAVA